MPQSTITPVDVMAQFKRLKDEGHTPCLTTLAQCIGNGCIEDDVQAIIEDELCGQLGIEPDGAVFATNELQSHSILILCDALEQFAIYNEKKMASSKHARVRVTQQSIIDTARSLRLRLINAQKVTVDV